MCRSRGADEERGLIGRGCTVGRIDGEFGPRGRGAETDVAREEGGSPDRESRGGRGGGRGGTLPYRESGAHKKSFVLRVACVGDGEEWIVLAVGDVEEGGAELVGAQTVVGGVDERDAVRGEGG